MDQEFLEARKKDLESEKARLEEALKGVSQKSEHGNLEAKFPDYGNKEEENAAEVTDFSTNLTVEANLEELLSATNKALEKIQNNTYGKCEDCGNEIAPARLEAFPSATLCVSCKEKEDKKSDAKFRDTIAHEE